MPYSFADNPRYQRALKRLQAAQPWQRAVLSSESLDRAMAGEDARRQLNYMLLGEQKAAREQRGQEFEQEMGFRRKLSKYGRKQANKAEIYNWANVGLSGITGWMDLKEKEALANRLGSIASVYRAGMR